MTTEQNITETQETKYIFVTGGVVSSIGKGITAASLGKLLIARGYTVSVLKLDPYINVDPGTMSPFQHGEVFVTADGAETDLDLGHYERFLDVELSQDANVTTGRIYSTVIARERRGDYLGATIQVIPHITDEIKNRIKLLSQKAQIILVEVGGTVGDIEGLPFLEAIRQFRKDVGKKNTLYIHLTLVPYIKSAGELKTKPSQHSVKELKSLGITPDILIGRCEQPIPHSVKEKLALFCDLDVEAVISAEDAQTIYDVPFTLEKEGLPSLVLSRLHLQNHKPNLSDWVHMVENIKNPHGKVTIGLVGKYNNLSDAYISVVEALKHSSIEYNRELDLVWIDAEDIEKDGTACLSGLDGIIVPGAFGSRGIEGKITAIEYARTNKIPYLGLCMGMQTAVIEYTRNVVGIKDATSGEFDPTAKNLVIDIMHDQKGATNKGGTMRLGTYKCRLQPNTVSASLYKADVINERHRHRYEVNNDFRAILQEKGLVVSGTSPDGELVEIVELSPDVHPFFVASQFHPEFQSKPSKPHPLFYGFIGAAIKQQ